MALNITNPEVERLAAEVAHLAHETKTEAIRKALEERMTKLATQGRRKRTKEQMIEYLERNVWPHIPAEVRGKRVTKREREKILGYGPYGV